MEEIKVADTARYVSFYAYDSADHISPADGITGFTVYYYLNNGSVTAMTTPTVTEKDSTNTKGWYTLAVDEAGMVSAEGVTSINIEASGMDPVAIKMKVVGNTTKEVYDRVGAPVGASISADLVVIDNFVDELESRLTAARAGYLDNLSAGAVALAATALTDATWTDAKAAFLDHAISTVDTNLDTLLTRITAARAGYLDNLSAGAVALAATALTDVTWTDAKAVFLDHSIATVDTVADGIQTDLDNATDGLGALKALIDTIDGIVDNILVDTTEIGTAGAGLTDLGGMSTSMKAEIESEASDALVAIKLDHLIAVADSDDPVNDSIISKLAASDGDWSGFDKTTDSQEAIRDRGDTSWVTGAGGSDRLLMVDTTIATLASQISFTLTGGSDDDDAYINCTIVIEDASTATQKAVGLISAYTGATKTVTLKYDPGIFTMAITDKVYILAENALKATLANRQLNVATDGDIAGNVDGSVASVVGAIGSVAGNVDGSVGSVVGAVGSVTGNVGGNVTGNVGSVVGHTAQTGDTYALANGASGFANIIADTNELQTDWKNDGRLDQILDAVKVKTDNLPDGIKKNTAITAYTFFMVQSSDHVTGATGLTVAGSYTGDGGAVTALANTGAITEISNGLYEIDLIAGELNYEHTTLIFTAAGADSRVITIHTST